MWKKRERGEKKKKEKKKRKKKRRKENKLVRCGHIYMGWFGVETRI